MKKARWARAFGFRRPSRTLFHIHGDAPLLQVARRARMEGDRRGARRLVGELEEARVLVHPHQLVLLLEHDLRDLVDEVLVGIGRRDQKVPHVEVRGVAGLAGVGVGEDPVLHVDRPVLLAHVLHAVAVVDELDGLAGRRGEVVMEGVGTPPTQKSASILPSFSAETLSATESRSRVMSLLGSMPNASMRRIAVTSVPLTGAPVETRLPFRSFIELMPLPSTVTTCMRLG